LIHTGTNNDGGTELDTSRCFMGRERFDTLAAMFPDATASLGQHRRCSLIWRSEARFGQMRHSGEGDEQHFSDPTVFASISSARSTV
jgi:hypothetical protein